MTQSHPTLVLFDGNALLHRAYHAFPKTLATSTGELTNAVYGFTSTLLTVFSKLKPTHAVMAFDVAGPTFRHLQYEGYKASRPSMDTDLASQLERTRSVVEVLNIPQFGVSGYEADDVIGTLSFQAQCSEVAQITIVTGDRDSLQLLNNCVQVYFPSRGKQPEKIVTEAEFTAEYGFKPPELVDYKALAGDASDEIPGVAGIGPKTAKDLVSRFHTIENLYNHLQEVSESVRMKLVAGKDDAYLSKTLATISTTVPITFDLAASELRDYDKEKAVVLFKELEFTSLLKRLPNDSLDEIFLTDEEEKKSQQHEEENQMKLF